MDWSENVKDAADEKENFQKRSLRNRRRLRRSACCYDSSGWRMCRISVVALHTVTGFVNSLFPRL
jgi:hypothetical protein